MTARFEGTLEQVLAELLETIEGPRPEQDLWSPRFVFDGQEGDERGLAAAAYPEHLPVLEALVDGIITWNKAGTAPVYLNEACELGTALIERLVRGDLTQIPRYLRFLESLDLAHTVEQLAVCDRLLERFGREALEPLILWLDDHGGELFEHWPFDPQLPKVETDQGPAILRVTSLEGLAEALRSGAEVNTADATGRRLLHVCAAWNMTELLQAALAAGAELEATDSLGRTALHAAALNGNYGIIKVLLAAGANRHLQDEEGKSPVDLYPLLTAM